MWAFRAVKRGISAAVCTLLAVTVAGCGGEVGGVSVGASAVARAGVGACHLPTLPAVKGPAATTFGGGAVTTPFVLDGGALEVDPPHLGDKPAISRLDAECTDLAADAMSGQLVSNPVAFPSGGLSVGYGLVSVRQTLITAAAATLGSGEASGVVAPKIVAPTPFQHRLAWVVVNTEQYVTSCPPSAGPAGARNASEPTSYFYGILILDANTAADSLIYYESTPEPCGGPGVRPSTVAVPVSGWSVPWTLVSRDSHDYSGSIHAQVFSCDGYDPTVNVERASRQVLVAAYRPIGASCQAPPPVTMTLQADTVFDTLPGGLEHAPLGLYSGFNPQLNPPPPTSTSVAAGPPPTEQPIVTLGQQSSGTTVNGTVGTVFFVMDLVPGPALVGQNRVVSSNPAVVGPLDAANSQEFRAWQTGQVTLTIPQQTCHASTPPCTGPWTVRINVG